MFRCDPDPGFRVFLPIKKRRRLAGRVIYLAKLLYFTNLDFPEIR